VHDAIAYAPYAGYADYLFIHSINLYFTLVKSKSLNTLDIYKV